MLVSKLQIYQMEFNTGDKLLFNNLRDTFESNEDILINKSHFSTLNLRCPIII